MRFFTVLAMVVMLVACGSIAPTDGYRAQYYALDEMKDLFVAGKYEEVVLAADAGLRIQVFEKTGERVVQGKLNRYEMRLLRAESNLILGNFDGLHSELELMRVDTPSEEVRTAVLLSRVYSAQKDSERAVAELMSLVRSSPGTFPGQNVIGSYVLVRYVDDGWKENYVEIAKLITDQLAVILSEDHGSADAIKASMEMLELGHKSDATQSVIVSQMAKGYDAHSLRLASEYLEAFEALP